MQRATTIAKDTIKVAYAIIAMHGARAAALADDNARSRRNEGDPYAALAWTHVAFAARALIRDGVTPPARLS